MGISLPPVTQITTTTSNSLTLHHRNRSLDSALQKIPEVDVTPSPEVETVANILGDAHTCKVNSSVPKAQHDELASLGSDDSGILCGSDSGSSDTNTTRESSVEFLSNPSNQSQESLDADSDVPDKIEITECLQNNKTSELSESSEVFERITQSEPLKHSTGILRLFESKFFDVPMSIQYLFNSKDPGVQSYIVNKMFSFEDSLVDFYLPQLVCMYIQMHDVAEVIHPYFIHR